MLTIPTHIRTAALPAAFEAVSTLAPVFRRYPRTRKALQAILLAQSAHKAIQKFRATLTENAPGKESWSVTVKGDDDLYQSAVELIARHTSTNWQAVEAELDYDYGDYDDDDDIRPSRKERASVKARPSERVERHFTVNGHPVSGYIDTFNTPRQAASLPGVPKVYRSPEAIFIADSAEGQAAILDTLKEIASERMSSTRKTARKPLLYTQRAYGGWDRSGELPIRPVDSVAVTDNQVQRVVDDILAFRNLEPEYVRRGIPFHRGYLLYGKPGTGKTSAIKAIAHAVGADLYAANLGTLNDASLSELVQGVSRSKAGAILLLEDIDSFGAARTRDEDDEGDKTGITAGISTTGLLNALDGVETPHGLVTILTTNHPEFLDDALVRPGRVDMRVLFDYPDDATVERHYEFFFSRKPSVRLYANGRSGAELNEVFVAHMTDPEGAEQALSAPFTPVEKPTAPPVRKAPVAPAADEDADKTEDTWRPLSARSSSPTSPRRA